MRIYRFARSAITRKTGCVRNLFLCILSYYVEWHLRQVWTELTFVDEEKGVREDPVSKAERSDSVKKKDSTKDNADGLRVGSFDGVMAALAALPMNTYRVGEGENSGVLKMPAAMTALQKRAIDLAQTI